MRRHQAHVDPVVLAEFREGLIGGHRAARIQTHLAGCERCAGIETRIAGVTALLAAAPFPVMPDGLARRVTEALAAEASARDLRAPRTGPAVAAAAAGSQPRHPRYAERIRGVTERFGGHGRLAARGFAGAAAACLLAVGGYTLARLGPSGTSGTASSTQAGPAQRQGPEEHGPVSGSQNYPYVQPPTAQGPDAGPVAPFTVVESGTDFQAAPRLARQVEAELATLGPGGAWRPPSGRRGTMTPAQEDCIRQVTDGITPTLVDVARYEGKPATVIALAGSPTLPGEALVVGRPSCTQLASVSLPAGS